MSAPADTFDLASLRLGSGEGRHLDVAVRIEPLVLGADRYAITPEPIDVQLDISRMTGAGYALRLRLRGRLEGPCMRCLEPAAPEIAVDAREISDPGSDDDELRSPYVIDQILDVAGWARDAIVLALPAAVLCRPDCAGLCPVCGANLNTAGPDHHHDPPPDPRWDALRGLTLE